MPSALEHSCTFPNFTQQAYRYGIALSCIGVLLNWLGVAKAYIEPVRYLGVGLVIVGSFLIIAAMCRWMFLAPHNVHQENGGTNSEGGSDLHVITVAMGRSPRTPANSCSPGNSRTLQSKPPDYFLVTEKPPSYEEAMSMLPPYMSTGPVQLQVDGNLGDFLSPSHSHGDLHTQHSSGGGATAGGSRDSPGRRELGRPAGPRDAGEGVRDSLEVTESLRKSSSNNSMEASGGFRDVSGVREVSALREVTDVHIDVKGSTRATPPPQYEDLLREIKENESKENKKFIEKEKENGLKESEIKLIESESSISQENEKQNYEKDYENERKELSSERSSGDSQDNTVDPVTESNTCEVDINICDQEVNASILENNLCEESPSSNEPSSSNASVHSSDNTL